MIFCPTGPAANFTNSQACSLRLLLAEIARPVARCWKRRHAPPGAMGDRQRGDIEIQAVGAHERLVAPVPTEAIAALPAANRSAWTSTASRRVGRRLVLVRQVGVELHRSMNAWSPKFMWWVLQRRGPWHAVVHGEQARRVVRPPRVDESPLRHPSGPSRRSGVGGVEELSESPRLVPCRGGGATPRWRIAFVVKQVVPAIAPETRTAAFGADVVRESVV